MEINNKQLRLYQQNFKDASYQNSNYSMVYNNPDKNVRSDLDKSVKTKVVTVDTAPGAILGAGLSLGIVGVTLGNTGSGYLASDLPTVTITGGGGGTGTTITPSIAGGTVSELALTVTEGGSGYTSAPSITVENGTGVTCLIVPTGVKSGAITAVDFKEVGSGDVVGTGYNEVPDITITSTNASATGASLTAVISGGSLTSATFSSLDGGSGGYTVANTTITVASPNVNATVSAVSRGLTGSITITYEGKGYTSAPTVTVDNTGTDGSSGAVTAVVTDGEVASAAVTTAGTGYTSLPSLSIAAPATTKFKEDLIEPLIVDRLSDVFLDSFTTFNCKANTSSDTSAFILDVEEFNIHSNSNNSKLAFNKCIIPNLATTATQTTVHKGKKLNYICSINPCRLRTLTTNLTILDGTTILAPDGGRYIAEFVIKPQAIKL